MKKRFVFRFTLVHEITLDEDQIYPDFPWYLSAEHADVPEARQSKAALTVADVEKTVAAAGGAAAIFRDWNMGPGLFEQLKAVELKVAPARPRQRKKRP